MSAVITLPNPFSRTSPRPVERESLFSTFTDLTAYASTSPIAYRGQIVSVSGTNTPYIISDQLSALPIALQSYVQSYAGGAFLPLSGGFVTGNIISNSTISANEIDVDNIQLEGNTISITSLNGDLNLTPNGIGEVNISRVDIDAGTIDSVTIGGTTAAISVSTALLNVDNIRVDGNVISSTNTGGNISLQPNSNTTTATGNLSASGTVTGNIVNATTGFKINNGNATAGNVLRGNGTNFVASTLAASDIASGQALTKTNDTNVTLSLGGSPSTALLAAASLTLGWTGQLAVGRGGTGSNNGSITGTGALTFQTGGANQDINLTTSGSGKVVIGNADINGGTIDGTSIGFTTPASGVFTGIRTTGDLSVGGNLFVEGSSAFINTTNIIVNDPIIFLAEGNPGDTVDIGFTGAYNHPSLPRHTGLVRDASNGGTGKWTLFSGLTSEILSATQIPFNDPSLVIDTLRANIEGTLTGNVSGTLTGNVSGTALRANQFTTGRIISASGDISYSSGSFDGSANVTGNATINNNAVTTLKIANDAVTYAKIQNVTTGDRILGRVSGAGDIEEIACTSSGRALISAANVTAQRNTLGLGSTDTVTFGEVIVNNGSKVVANDVYNTSGTNPINITTFSKSTYQSGKFTAVITRTSNNHRCTLEILAADHNGTWEGTVYGIVDPGGIFQNVDIGVTGSTVDLSFTLSSAVNHNITVYAQALSA